VTVDNKEESQTRNRREIKDGNTEFIDARVKYVTLLVCIYVIVSAVAVLNIAVRRSWQVTTGTHVPAINEMK
jgi:hypothetical protein